MISLPLPYGGSIKNIIHVSDIHIRLGDRKTSRYDEYDYVFNNLYEDFLPVIVLTTNTDNRRDLNRDSFAILTFDENDFATDRSCSNINK